MAHVLTAVRLVLAAPTAVAFASPDLVAPGVLALILSMAIATDLVDGPVARWRGSASAGGQLFDHGTDCLFVTAGLAGAAWGGSVTPLLPVVVPVAFGQYVLDSYFHYRQKTLRANAIGRWNGVLYFAPLVLLGAARLPAAAGVSTWLTLGARGFAYALVASTIVSAVDRATAPFRKG